MSNSPELSTRGQWKLTIGFVIFALAISWSALHFILSPVAGAWLATFVMMGLWLLIPICMIIAIKTVVDAHEKSGNVTRLSPLPGWITFFSILVLSGFSAFLVIKLLVWAYQNVLLHIPYVGYMAKVGAIPTTEILTVPNKEVFAKLGPTMVWYKIVQGYIWGGIITFCSFFILFAGIFATGSEKIEIFFANREQKKEQQKFAEHNGE